MTDIPEATAPRPTRRDPLPSQPEGTSWPTEAWPLTGPADVPDGLDAVLARAFGPTADPDLDLTLATVIIHRGRLVAERYSDTAGPDETLISWSMGKSATQAMVGMLVQDGLLDVDAPAEVEAWADDERAAITLQQLLQMTSGLDFQEDYVDDKISHVIDMLFGDGADDVAAYAAARPLAHDPGTVFNYSSGTTNIISAICGEVIAAQAGPDKSRQEAVTEFLQARLFEPLGMTSADPHFDTAGTFVGSSYLYCTAQDFARFGLLYLRDGVWDGERLLPEDWVARARNPVDLPLEEAFWYGAHWWLWDDRTGAFAAQGYEGQFILIVPASDLIIVRLGKTPVERRDAMVTWLHDIIELFPTLS